MVLADIEETTMHTYDRRLATAEERARRTAATLERWAGTGTAAEERAKQAHEEALDRLAHLKALAEQAQKRESV